jgi:hypothetical protein
MMRGPLSGSESTWGHEGLGRPLPWLKGSIILMAMTTRLLSTLSEEEIVSIKVRLALKYYWYKHIISIKKPLVLRDY